MPTSRLLLIHAATLALAIPLEAQQSVAPAPRTTLFTNVRVFDGTGSVRSAPSNVLVRGNLVERISAAPIAVPASANTTVVDGRGRTLMPGLIDAHVHLALSALTNTQLLGAEPGFTFVMAGAEATRTLLRGITTVRDLGGPTFGIKRAIDLGVIPGPRIFPSGAMVSQTAGHGDFRLPNDVPSQPGAPISYAERLGASAIADGVDQVHLRVREQLRGGASQIKLMAGGGVSSDYDPIDASQYTVAEFRAAVDDAENWGTYVTVHAYTPRAIRAAIDGGVRCIEHGQLMDDATARLMAEKKVWLSVQPFVMDDEYVPLPNAVNRAKQETMYAGTDSAIAFAKRHGVKIALGTDKLRGVENASRQNADLAKFARWFTPTEVLRMLTSGNAELLALSGPRHPYAAAPLGVVKPGAYADLLLVEGDPTADLSLIADPARNFVVIMKDGVVVRNTTTAR
jgi:imidazolonepropionase-like amidohydrolase